MRIRGHLLLLWFLLLAVPAGAAEWLTELSAAVIRARDERKLILVQYRPDCGRCNKSIDELLKQAEAEPYAAHAMEGMLLLRLTEATEPSIVVIDPQAEVVWKPGNMLPTVQQFSSILVRLREQEPLFIRAAELKREGKTAEADVVFASALLNLNASASAAGIYERAAAAFRARKDYESAQYAEISAGFAWYVAGQKSRGGVMIDNARRNPVSKDNEVEAWWATAGIRRIDRDLRLAIKAYRKVYDLSAPNSPLSLASRAALEEIDKRPLPPKPGEVARATLRVVPPARKTVSGTGEFLAESDVDVDRVEWFLDDVPVTTSTRKPHRVKIDLGDTPRMRVVKAVAYKADVAAGEAVVTVNDRADAFRVSIVSPAANVVADAAVVEAAASVPPGKKLTRLDIYWNNEKLASLNEAPFRANVKTGGAFGYVRVVGVLDDGTTAEETKLLNASGVTENVDVQGVTLIATVVDKEGKRISGLTAKDFVVQEEGSRVDAAARESADEPVTIGLAIDSSLSMNYNMLTVTELATEFLESGKGSSDRVFAVAFDHAARLLSPATTDTELLKDKILELRARGGTSLFDGIVFALQQFQGVPGKKALVVISDGQEVASSQSAAACERLSKDTGIPIYTIIIGGSLVSNPLIRLAKTTGALPFFRPKRSEWPAMFQTIRDEARGQYLITFISPSPAKSGTWRELKVSVPSRKEAVVRTMPGYFVR